MEVLKIKDIRTICDMYEQGLGYEEIFVRFNNARSLEDKGVTIGDDTAHKVCKMMSEGIPKYLISKELGIPTSTINNIRYSAKYTNIVSQYTYTKRVKLDESTVEEARKMLKEGVRNKVISRMLGIPLSSVSKIRTGRTYKADDNNVYVEGSEISEDLIKEAYDLLLENRTYKEVSLITGISVSTIGRIRWGTCKKYKKVIEDYKNELKMAGKKYEIDYIK